MIEFKLEIWSLKGEFMQILDLSKMAGIPLLALYPHILRWKLDHCGLSILRETVQKFAMNIPNVQFSQYLILLNSLLPLLLIKQLYPIVKSFHSNKNQKSQEILLLLTWVSMIELFLILWWMTAVHKLGTRKSKWFWKYQMKPY